MSDEIGSYAKRKKKMAIWRTVLICTFAVAILGTATYFVLTRFFVAGQVVVQGTDLYPKEDILAACGMLAGEHNKK